MIQAAESETRVRILNSITTELARIVGSKERLMRLTELVVPLLGDWCIVDMVNENGKLERVAVAHSNQEKVKELRRVIQKYGVAKESWIYKAVMSGKPQVFNSVGKEMLGEMNLRTDHAKRVLKLGMGAGVIALLEARGKRLGTLTIIRDIGKRPFDKNDVEFITNLAAQVGIFIDNSMLLAKATQQLVEQKKARRALHDSEAALRLALNAGRMGVWDWEINTGKVRLSRDSENLYGINPGKFGGSLEEVVGKIIEADREKALREIKMAVKERGRYYSEYRVTKNHGEVRWLMSVGKVIVDRIGVPVRMLGVISDITDRKETEESLRQSEKKFKTIFQNAMDMIMIADRHGRILDVNPAGIKLWGRPVGEVMKMRMSDLVDENREEIKNRWKNLPEQDTQVGEIVVSTAKGAEKILEYAASTNILPHQDLFIFRDITDRVMEEKRREHFLGIASHELRSPLASIKAFNYLIKKLPGMTKYPKAWEYLEKIDDKVDTVARLIGDLLDVTRIRQGKLELVLEEFDFDQAVEEAVAELNMTVRSHRIMKSGKTGKRICADKRKIMQVLINLIRNAVKYSPKAKKIEVKVGGGGKDEVKVAVKDYGLGIAKEDKEKIFELYFRGSDERKENIRGLGVGLYISEQIIHRHYGKIWVESQKNKGSTFYFTLPVEHEQENINN